MRALIAFSFFLALSGCASDPYMWPDTDAGSPAHGDAYAADAMHFRKPMPDRREHKSWDFYYKHCSMNGQETYFSKTSYDCNGPF